MCFQSCRLQALLTVGILFCALPSLGYADCIGELGGSDPIELKNPTFWNCKELVVPDDPNIIITNGHNLVINIFGDLTFNGDLTITSFTEDRRKGPDRPNVADNGRNGEGYERGPHTSGRGTSLSGRDGAQGEPGKTGDPGTQGENSGSIAINVGGDIQGTGMLRIRNVGMHGGPGGQGGNGGRGGDGEQGGEGEPRWVKLPFGGISVAGCSSLPGHGGDGGQGGEAGNGGQGGRGGNGGDVFLSVTGKTNAAVTLSVDLAGGRGGEGGDPGIPGDIGDFGFGGRSVVGCPDMTTERNGQNGKRGQKGHHGPSGQAGTDGKLRESHE